MHGMAFCVILVNVIFRDKLEKRCELEAGSRLGRRAQESEPLTSALSSTVDVSRRFANVP